MMATVLKLILLCGTWHASAFDDCPLDAGICQAGRACPSFDEVSLLVIKNQLHKAEAGTNDGDQAGKKGDGNQGTTADCGTWAPGNNCAAVEKPPGSTSKTGFCNNYWMWSSDPKYGLTTTRQQTRSPLTEMGSPGDTQERGLTDEVVMCRNTAGVTAGCRDVSSLTKDVRTCAARVFTQVIQKCEVIKSKKFANALDTNTFTDVREIVSQILGNGGFCGDALDGAECVEDLGLPYTTQKALMDSCKKLIEAKKTMTPEQMRAADPPFFENSIASTLESKQADFQRLQDIVGIYDFIMMVEREQKMDEDQFLVFRRLMLKQCGCSE